MVKIFIARFTTGSEHGYFSVQLATILRPVVNVIKLFGRKFGKSRFPLNMKEQEKAILKVINSFKEYFCLKIALFKHFISEQTFSIS